MVVFVRTYSLGLIRMPPHPIKLKVYNEYPIVLVLCLSIVPFFFPTAKPMMNSNKLPIF